MALATNLAVGDALPANLNATNAAINSAKAGVIYADDYATIADALSAAASGGIPRVVLNPTGTYTISSTLTVPAEVELDGGGRNATSLAVGLNQLRAEIRASAALDPMISLGSYSSLSGVWLNGNATAAGAIQAVDVVRPKIEDCLIEDFTDYGIRCGGVLYPVLRNNVMTQIDGYGLDALQSYGSDYYGINVGVSENNEYKGLLGHIRLEGILTSLSDDFESTGFDGSYVIEVGASVQSQLTMIGPYFELTADAASPLIAIRLNTSASLTLIGGQAFGNASDSTDQFINCNNPDMLTVQGCKIQRFAVVYEGTLDSTTDVVIAGNYYSNNTLINGLTGLDVTNSGLIVLAGTRLGVS